MPCRKDRALGEMCQLCVDARMVHNSGIGTVLRNVLQRWIPQAPDIFFTLLGDPAQLGQYAWARADNVRIVSCLAPIYTLREQWEVRRLVPEGTGLLWVPHYDIPVFYTGKMLVTVHDVFHLDMQQLVPGLHKRLYAKLMFHAVARKADHIICDSHFTAGRLRHFEPQLPEDRVSVIYNGVDSFWQEQPAETGRLYSRPYILFVGNVKPNKNLRKLVEALALLRDRIEEDLVIVGRREGFIVGDEATVRLAESMGSRVHFTGYASDEDLRRYYRDASVLAFPSLYEGFGLPPLEALAAGCRRLLLNDIPVLHEVFGRAASYVDARDSSALAGGLQACLASEGIPDELALAKVSEYKWEQTAARTAALARRTLSGA